VLQIERKVSKAACAILLSNSIGQQFYGLVSSVDERSWRTWVRLLDPPNLEGKIVGQPKKPRKRKGAKQGPDGKPGRGARTEETKKAPAGGRRGHTEAPAAPSDDVSQTSKPKKRRNRRGKKAAADGDSEAPAASVAPSLPPVSETADAGGAVPAAAAKPKRERKPRAPKGDAAAAATDKPAGGDRAPSQPAPKTAAADAAKSSAPKEEKAPVDPAAGSASNPPAPAAAAVRPPRNAPKGKKNRGGNPHDEDDVIGDGEASERAPKPRRGGRNPPAEAAPSVQSSDASAPVVDVPKRRRGKGRDGAAPVEAAPSETTRADSDASTPTRKPLQTGTWLLIELKEVNVDEGEISFAVVERLTGHPSQRVPPNGGVLPRK
jgi:hypothetical protein